MAILGRRGPGALNINITGDKALVRVFNRLRDKAPKVAREQLNISARAIQADARRTLFDHTDTGALVESLEFGRGSRLAFQTRLEILVGSDLPYARPVEFGAKFRGGMPPSAALRDWAARHGMAGAEFAIARNIGRRGLPARPFLFPAFERERPRMLRRMKRRYQKLASSRGRK